MLIKLEPDTAKKIYQIRVWAANFQKLPQEKLFKLACDPKQKTKNINTRLDAIFTLRHKFELIAKSNDDSSVLTDQDVEQLYKLMIDDENFPVLVNVNDFAVEEVTCKKGYEDIAHKKAVKRDLEENVALLRAEAAKLILDFGNSTKRFNEIRGDFIKSIKEILSNMLCEQDQIFASERKMPDNSEKMTVSNYFKSFVEVLYFIDKESARPFMSIFDIKETDFSYERRAKNLLNT